MIMYVQRKAPGVAMRKMLLYMLLASSVICNLFLLSACEEASIISSPKSVNISRGENVVFNCTAIATFINWEVDGVSINRIFRSQGFQEIPTTDLNVTENLRRKSLQVLGSPHSNNVSIVCVAVLQVSATMFDGASSKPALVLVQGLLESVSNITMTLINSTTVLISWSPPFTLEGVPILGYNVTITNTTSGENETMLVEDTTLQYSIDRPDPEKNFTVTVVPINEVGAGEPALLTIASGNLQLVVPVEDPTSTIQETHSTELWLGNVLSKAMTTSVHIKSSPSLSATQTTAGFVHITTVASVLIAISVTTVLAILSIIIVIAVCVVHFKQIDTTPPQDVLTVSKNPAYELTVIIQRNSTKKSSSNPARTHQYENVDLWNRQA